jgi:DNA-binding FadR family transcriptional regulator
MAGDEPRASRSGMALEHIRALVEANASRPAWRLPPERELAGEIGTGRRAVRCALEVLEAEGRVWRQQGRGTFAGHRPDIQPHLVASLSERTSPLEVMEARLEIEPGLARLAAAKATAEVVANLQRILQRIGASADADSVERWDGAFHRTIAETAGNGLLLTIFGVIDQIRQLPSWQKPRAQARNTERLRVVQVQHAAILAAIARHDGAEAEQAMRRHLLTLQANLQQTLLGLRARDATPLAEADRPWQAAPDAAKPQ